MSAQDCIAALKKAAGRDLTDEEIRGVFERIHKAALDIKAGRVSEADVQLGGALGKEIKGQAGETEAVTLIQKAAARAAKELEAEAAAADRQADLQIIRLGARQGDVEIIEKAGLKSLEAVEGTLTRNYSGLVPVESLEQKVAGYKSYFEAKVLATWDALGRDYLGFFQDREKVLNLVRELRGEDTGEVLAKKGAEVYHEVAEEARQTFNENGGVIGKLDDWGMPQHHSQQKVALAGKEDWIDFIMPILDRKRYVDDLGNGWDDARMRDFLSHAYDTISTNGLANIEPGQSQGWGKRANRHAEDRQIHFKDAESVIKYWEAFGEKTVLEILHGHLETMAKDIGFIEHYGPNPNMTFQTLLDEAVKKAALADPTQTDKITGQRIKLQTTYNYAAGRTTPSVNTKLSNAADILANLNTAGKLGGAALASLFGDKPMMEAVSHLNSLPAFRRWSTELSLLNPANGSDRRLIQQQGLMLDSVRSGLQRFYEGLGKSSFTGRLANAIMRITGMQAINDIRKGSFGVSLMHAIGGELGKDFNALADSDVRTLTQYGITEADWKVWKMAPLLEIAGNDKVLAPEGISQITDAQLVAAGLAENAAQAQTVRRQAIVKLLGAVNTESEFAIVTPGWKERSAFYGTLQRGTILGEISRSVLQFKSFPWAMFQRGMDAVANAETPTGKAGMVAYLVMSTTLAGAMLMQTREMLSGKDPRDMTGRQGAKPLDLLKFWGAAFLQGGALGIYGDFLYSTNQTRYGTGPLEALAGPTVGPLLELFITQPANAAKARLEGRDTHLAAQTIQDLKGFLPGGNIWYAKAALDHLIWQRVMDALSPGYLNNMRAKTQKEYGQAWWYEPGATTPQRAPDLGKAIGQ